MLETTSNHFDAKHYEESGEMRRQEGLSKVAHKYAEDILRDLKKGGDIISIGQSEIDVL